GTALRHRARGRGRERRAALLRPAPAGPGAALPGPGCVQVRDEGGDRGAGGAAGRRGDLWTRRARVSERAGMNPDVVTLAIPCRSDEPALGRTLAAAWASWQAATQATERRLEVLACVNGDAAAGRARGELLAFARARNATLTEVDLDASTS